MAPMVQLLLYVVISGALGTVLTDGSIRNIQHWQSRIGGLETFYKSPPSDTSSLTSPTHEPRETVDSQIAPNIQEATSTSPSLVIVKASKRRNRNRNIDKERRHRSWSVLHQHYHYHHHHLHHRNNSNESRTNHDKSRPESGHVLPVGSKPGSVQESHQSKFNESKKYSVNRNFESLEVPYQGYRSAKEKQYIEKVNNRTGINDSQIGVMHQGPNFGSKVSNSIRNYGNQTPESSEVSSDESTSEKSFELSGKETEKTGSISKIGRPIRTKRNKPHSESNINDRTRISENQSSGSDRVSYQGNNSALRKEDPLKITERTDSDFTGESQIRTKDDASLFTRNLNDSKKHSEYLTIESGEVAYHGKSSEIGDEHPGKVTEPIGINSTKGILIRTKHNKLNSESNINDGKRISENQPSGSDRVSYQGNNSALIKEDPLKITGRTDSDFTGESQIITKDDTSLFRRNLNDSKKHYEYLTIESREVAYHGKSSEIGDEQPGKVTDPIGINSTQGILIRTKHNKLHSESSINDGKMISENQPSGSDRVSYQGNNSALRKEDPIRITERTDSDFTGESLIRTKDHTSLFRRNLNDSKKQSVRRNLTIESREVAYHGKRSEKGDEYPGKVTEPIGINSTKGILIRTKCRKNFFGINCNVCQRHSEILKPGILVLSSRGSHSGIGNEFHRKKSDLIGSNFTEGIGLLGTVHHITYFNDSKWKNKNLSSNSEVEAHHGRRPIEGNLGKEIVRTGSSPSVGSLVRTVHRRPHIRNNFNDSKWPTQVSEETSYKGSHTTIGNEYPRTISGQIAANSNDGIWMKTKSGRSDFNVSRRNDENQSPESDDISSHDRRSILSKEYLEKETDRTGNIPTEGSRMRNKRDRPRSMIDIRYNDSRGHGDRDRSDDRPVKRRRRPKQRRRQYVSKSSGSNEDRPQFSHHSSW